MPGKSYNTTVWQCIMKSQDSRDIEMIETSGENRTGNIQGLKEWQHWKLKDNNISMSSYVKGKINLEIWKQANNQLSAWV